MPESNSQNETKGIASATGTAADLHPLIKKLYENVEESIRNVRSQIILGNIIDARKQAQRRGFYRCICCVRNVSRLLVHNSRNSCVRLTARANPYHNVFEGMHVFRNPTGNAIDSAHFRIYAGGGCTEVSQPYNDGSGTLSLIHRCQLGVIRCGRLGDGPTGWFGSKQGSSTVILCIVKSKTLLVRKTTI